MTSQNSLPSMQGKTCLVTGATAGIGYVTARELTRAGGRVLIVARNAEKGAEAARRIAEETGSGGVEALAADLSSQAEVRSLAREVKGRVDRLDVLINNAGVILLDRRESVDGIEATFAVNHLAYFLLTNLLLDLLKASSPSRVVNVASAAHRGGKIHFDDIGGREHYSGWRAYQQSKLANILFTRELARALTGTGVTANAVHPGYVNSQIFREEGLRGLALRLAASLFAISPERGAETTLYLATSPDVQGESGEYYVRCKPASVSREARNDADARRLWQFSEDLSGMKNQTV
jgi:NAD(P)-dependent dehydrogenase (short-subunit alcohol dehydrogenase family)